MVYKTINSEMKFRVCNEVSNTGVELNEGLLADGDASLDENNCSGCGSSSSY